MLLYTNYDPADGRIIQSGLCPNEDCLPTAEEGTEWLYGVIGMPDRDIVIDGEVHANLT